MPDDASEYLRLILQELKALNLRLDRAVDRIEAVRSDLKTEWRFSAKRLETLRGELHTDLSILKGELMQLRGLTAARSGSETERAPATEAVPARRTRKKAAAAKGRGAAAKKSRRSSPRKRNRPG